MAQERSKGTVTAYYPGADFPSVSVTGGRCDLMCEHCRAVHLRGMAPVRSNDELIQLANGISSRNGTGLLLSGGCDMNGTVPVNGFVNAVSKISEGLDVNVHAGFVTAAEAAELAEAGVSCFSADVHQDPGEIAAVLHLDRPPEDYSKLLDDLISTGVKVMPHITAGFGYDDLWLSGKLIVSKGLKEVVLLSIVPTEGTAVEESVLTEDAIITALKALQSLGLEVILGCMRDRSLRGLEKRCIEEGVRRIANPSSETVRWAEENGYEVVKRRICCCYS